MCGIFGVVKVNNNVSSKDLLRLYECLFKLSESRGKESCGVALRVNSEVLLLKEIGTFNDLKASKAYQNVITAASRNFQREDEVVMLGHSRLVTNGAQFMHENNQPVNTNHSIAVHNGIIVNSSELHQKYFRDTPEPELDTQVLLNLFSESSTKKNPQQNINDIFQEIKGTASVAIMDSAYGDALILASNNGSLYTATLPECGLFCFASEYYILEQSILAAKLTRSELTRISKLDKHKPLVVSKTGELNPQKQPLTNRPQSWTIKHLNPDASNLLRCTKCILPETFPRISFNGDGICNYCSSNHNLREKRDFSILAEQLAKHRKNDGTPDCLVAFSGGRDSCYGLHYLVTELNMHPIVFTYDWGMVTNIARRNTARICQELGLEHIIISADIPAKRKNIRRNVQAWLKKPHLGMIPLFMAGDKQFYYYAEKLKKQMGIDLLLFCDGCHYEKTDFKTGFCGIKEGDTKGTLFNVSFYSKLRLVSFYLSQFILNPRYLNASMFDTFFAFYSAYFLKKNYLHLYHYIDWDEDDIEHILISKYGWEKANDTTATWRIGDGTAPLYNYIYHTVAGFSEHDTFRSNQIRSGALSRKIGLKKASSENKPRYESIREYSDLIGVSYSELMNVINTMDKLYEK